MPNILLWTPESDYDNQTIKILAQKIIEFYRSQSHFQIFTMTKQAYIVAVQKDPQKGLQTAVNILLKQYDLVLFLIDTDSIQSQHQRLNQQNSYINQIRRVVNNKTVFLVEIKQELEAWLLVDCLGICCYYTKQATTRNNAEWQKFSQKYQKGDTQFIIEAELGGKGAKEYLEDFSDAINLKINPNLSQKLKNLKDKRYQEKDSPNVANHLLIKNQTLSRNLSLRQFAQFFTSPEEN